MVEQTFSLIGNAVFVIWNIGILLFFTKRIACRPDQLVRALIIAGVGLLIGVIAISYFNGPYLLKYLK